MRSASAARSTGAAPRWPCSSGAARTEEIRSETSTSVSGGIRCPTSPSSSVGGPATLKLTTGPNSGSSAVLTTQGTPGVGHPLHDERVGRRAAPAVSTAPANASRTLVSLPRSTRTPLPPTWWRTQR